MVPVLSPAGTPIPSASDGPFGFGCVGEGCFSVRRCRLCTSLSSLRVPGDDGETATSSAHWWNKSFRPRSRPVGVHSGARWRLVKVRSAGFGASASILGSSCTGVMSCSASRLVPVEAMTSQCIGCKGEAGGSVVLWSVELLCPRRQRQLVLQERLGRVPGRCVLKVVSIPFPGTGGCCGSFRSFHAKLVVLFYGELCCSGGFQRPTMWSTIGASALLFVFLSFSRSFCVSRVEQLFFPYPVPLYLYRVFSVFLKY